MRQNTPNIPPIAPVSALRLSYQPQNIDRIDLALNLFQQPARSEWRGCNVRQHESEADH